MNALPSIADPKNPVVLKGTSPLEKTLFAMQKCPISPCAFRAESHRLPAPGSAANRIDLVRFPRALCSRDSSFSVIPRVPRSRAAMPPHHAHKRAHAGHVCVCAQAQTRTQSQAYTSTLCMQMGTRLATEWGWTLLSHSPTFSE